MAEWSGEAPARPHKAYNVGSNPTSATWENDSPKAKKECPNNSGRGLSSGSREELNGSL